MKISEYQWKVMVDGIGRIVNLFSALVESTDELVNISKINARYDFDPHKDSCGNCVFAHKVLGTVKECRVNAPIRTTENSGWPRVRVENGCGQHRGFTQ